MRHSYTIVGLLVDILVLTIAFAIAMKAYTTVMIAYKRIVNDMDRFIDFVMAVNFVRDEIKSRIVRPHFEASSTALLSYCGYSNGEVKLITYYIRSNGEEWRMYRKAAGEGNNLIWKSEKPIYFDIDGDLVRWYLEEKVFYIWEPDDFEKLKVLPGTYRYEIPDSAYTSRCKGLDY
ncbi:MAG: hypothetical protein J7L34_00135 [Thermotogaceae bacterium]|nr:hypothetical protein [Thermotogaceae bacterium]